MRRRSSAVLLVLVLGLLIAACGSDDESGNSEGNEAQADSTTVVLPPYEVAKKDGARAHSESDVYECSSTDLEGDVGTAAFGGFQDISVRGIGCENGRKRIVAAYDTYEDGEVAESVDGYDCAVIERYGDGLDTVRCFEPNGDASLRFTIVPAKRKAVELVAECGTFDRFHDLSVRGQSCRAAATFLDDTPTSELTAIPEGDKATLGGRTCTTLYVEGGSRTVRCTKGDAALRVSIAPKPSTAHPSKFADKPKEDTEDAVIADKTKKETKPARTYNLSPRVTISCTAAGPFNAITAKGIGCAAVTRLLTESVSVFEAMDDKLPIEIYSAYTCNRIDKGNQTSTVRCVGGSGVSFRASFVAPSATPASGNPPATTTPTGDPVDTDTTTTTTPTTPDATTPAPNDTTAP